MRYGNGLGVIKGWQLRAPRSVSAWFSEEHADSRAIVLQATTLWAVTRAGLALLTYFTLILHKELLAPGTNPTVSFTELVQQWNLRWDANYYRIIGLQGYPPGTRAFGAFFPFYP